MIAKLQIQILLRLLTAKEKSYDRNQSCFHDVSSRSADNSPDRSRQAKPVFPFLYELASPAPGHRVVLRLTVVFGRFPTGRDPALLFQPVKGRIERSLIDLQNAF